MQKILAKARLKVIDETHYGRKGRHRYCSLCNAALTAEQPPFSHALSIGVKTVLPATAL